MNVGTDFSGIGAPETALKYLGINFKSVFACDIDKYAKQSFLQLHKTKKFYNDITTRDHKEVEQLDLYIAGFPCQAFSMAGKRKGFEETRGTLFFNVAEFIKINQPKVFVLENVKGLLSHDSGRTFQTIVDILSNNGGTQNGQISLDMFDDGLGYNIYWQVLNTKNYGIPQNRERIFIVGFKDFRQFSFPKPIQLKLKLGDMLQDNPKHFKLLDDYNSKFINNNVIGTLTCNSGSKAKRNGFKLFIQNDSKKVDDKYYLSDKAKNKIKRHNNKSTNNDISNCIHAGYYKQGGRDQQYIKVENKYFLSDKMTNYVLNTNYNVDKPISKEGISRCLKVGGDVPCFEVETNIKKIRRLTPLECWRLQGFLDKDFYKVKNVSDTQLYKQAGNSITVDVLMHLFSKIYI